MVWGLLFGGAALFVVGAAISVVCDEMSEKERCRQEKLKREHAAYRERKEQEYRESCAYFERERQRADYEHEVTLREYQRKLIERRKEENRAAFQQMLDIWQEQYEEKEKLLKECREIVQSCEVNIRDKQQTFIRYNSMKTTIVSLQEAVFKLDAYIQYMDDYKQEMKESYELEGTLPDPFSMTLPEGYPYEGKVIYLKKSEFNGYQCNICSGRYLNLEGSEKELFDNINDDRQPYMITASKKGHQYLSLSKGILKKSIGSTMGLDMEVVNVYPKYIRLRFLNNEYIKIRLPKENLINRNRRTPIGSALHVFVTDYDFALKGRIIVSERAVDGMSIAQFDSVAMIQTEKENEEFYEHLQKNNLLEEKDEWRIGPYTDDDGDLSGLILQCGNSFAILVAFETLQNDELVLRYKKLLPRDEFIPFDGLFVAANVTLDCYSQDSVRQNPDAYKAYYEECQKMRLYLTKEFAVQRKILSRSPMSVYLEQWLTIMARLIEYHLHGGHIQIKVDEWKLRQIHRYQYTLLHVENEKEFRRFVESEEKRGRKRFFVEVLRGEGSKLNCRVFFDEEDGIWLRLAGEITEQDMLETGFAVELYTVGNAYTERQQANAFSMFKEGRTASEEIMAAVINAREYRYTDSGQRITELFNKQIQTNDRQLRAVTRAFGEKSFFMIQGPPGTGKTTVIKELILQQLKHDPNSKIIVVSQANVAVDNVLRGVVKVGGRDAEIVRCGNEDRIAEDMEAYSFDKKFEIYQERLRTERLTDVKLQTLREKWLRIIAERDNTDLVGECLLNCYQIIGATCLGLENRHYGLTGMEFDLAVIDEAGKALAGELLIPINRAKKVVIIGDHMQLPPVVDPALYRGGDVEYDDVVDDVQQDDFMKKSFFQRLYEDCPDESKCMLNVQFRMPPVIADLVSGFFYDGKLETGENCLCKRPIFLNNHLIFVDMKDEADYREKQDVYVGGAKSGPYNEKELEAAAGIIRRIREHYTGRIVVITPYKNQKKRLIMHLRQEALQDNVWVNTIDAFQGDEADVVLYCTTRADRKTDYFSDTARLNVAFSRARNTLIFLGSDTYLKKYPHEHILPRISDYLAEHAVVIPYREWEQTELCYDSEYSCETGGTISRELLPIPVGVEQKRLEEGTPAETCMACGKTLEKTESKLCAVCINKIDDSQHCKNCGKSILIPYYSKYIYGKTAEDLCVQCQAECYELTVCSECGEEFYLPHDQLVKQWQEKKEILCPTCDKYMNTSVRISNCCHCNQAMYLTRREIKQRKREKKSKILFCQACEEESKKNFVIGNCKHCNREIVITYGEKWGMETSGRAYPDMCVECRKESQEKVEVGVCELCGTKIVVSKFFCKENPHFRYDFCWQCKDKIAERKTCSICGQEYTMTYSEKRHFEQNEAKGKYMRNICQRCWKEGQTKVAVGRCSICGAEIKINKLQYDKAPSKEYKICKKCWNTVAERRFCNAYGCNELFEITYGEKLYYEERGLCLPKKCPQCRQKNKGYA